MLSNSQSSYGWLAISIHWLSAVVVLSMFTIGLWMVDLDYYSEWYNTAPDYHKSVGILLAIMTVFRVFWTRKQVTPQALGKNWEKKSAKAAHFALYTLLFCLFISGYLISTADGRGVEVFNWFAVPSMGEFVDNQEDIAGEVHEWLAYSMISLVVLHALAALKHHSVDKDTSLIRMLKPLGNKQTIQQTKQKENT
jgi:cytochrome b561